MEFIQEITLDLNANTTYTTVAAKQRDSARWLKIHLTKNNLSYNLDPSHSFMFRMRKPDGHGVINPAFVELNSTDLYIPIEITKDNYNNYVNYYKEIEDNVYETVPVSTFFSQIETYEDGCYVQDANDRYIEATSEDSPPYYEFIGAPVGITIYYLQNNINFAESTVNVQLTEQVLAVPGRGYADIIEYDGIGNVLSSVSFIVNIMASPDVAGNATSTDEFQKLADVVADADNIIGEAETWTRGTNKGINVAGPSFEKYNSENFGPSEFNQRNKEYLYIKSNDSYVQVGSTASFDPNQTYYGLDASIDHNAKLYAEQAATQWDYYNNLTVIADPSYTGTVASVNINRNTAGMATQYVFSLPAGPQGIQGATGPTGPATCVASDSEPTNPDVLIWLDTNGSMAPFLGTAEQVYYDAAATYGSNTVGYALQGVNKAEQDAEIAAQKATAAENAAASASASAALVDDVKADVSKLMEAIYGESAFPTQISEDGEIQDRIAADSSLQTQIDARITRPNVDWDEGIRTLLCTVPGEDSDAFKIEWGQDSYNNLKNRPRINNEILEGDLNLNLIVDANKTVKLSHLDDDITTSLNKADAAVQAIQLNDELLTPANYIAPYYRYTQVSETNWNEVKNSLYYYNSSIQDYEKVSSEATYSSDSFYFTHDSSYDNQKFIDLGTVLKEDNITNNNLLDNAWFQINQYGLSSQSVSSNDVYICDRWKVMECQDQTRTITLTSSGLTISTASGQVDALQDFAIGQVFDEKFSQSLSAKNVCLSIGYTKGEEQTVQYGSGFALCTAQGTPFIQIGDGLGWFIRLTQVTETNKLAFQIVQAQNITGEQFSDSQITIKNVKLEIGQYSTLKQDIAPIYSEELAKCQKYFYKIEGQEYSETESPTVVGFGIAGAAKQVDWSFSVPHLITSTAATIAASTNLIIRRGITATANAGILTPEAIAASIKFNGINGIYLQTATTNALTTYAPYYILLPNAASSSDSNPYITINAEL